MPTTENTFWQFDTSYWFQKLNSSPQGLSQAVADKILFEKGLHPKSKSGLKKDLLLFISQFKSPLMLLLIGAVIISAFLGDRSDVFIILFIVLSTGLLSFFQERNAGRVVEKLQSMISLKAAVLRNGEQKETASDQIVTGDVIILNAGDMLPADCLIIEASELYVNESSLTGESYPARKEEGIVDETAELTNRTNCLWEGTNVVSGNAKALVIQTGEQTIFGTIAKSASGTVETSFEKGIKDFGFFLMKITMILAVFILVVNLFNHKGIYRIRPVCSGPGHWHGSRTVAGCNYHCHECGCQTAVGKKSDCKKTEFYTKPGGGEFIMHRQNRDDH